MTPRRVLVVDDNIDYAATEAFLLTFDGHQVRVAADGRSAIEAAIGSHPARSWLAEHGRLRRRASASLRSDVRRHDPHRDDRL